MVINLHINPVTKYPEPLSRDYILPQLAVYHLYTAYILCSGGLYNPYHLRGEPETTIELGLG